MNFIFSKKILLSSLLILCVPTISFAAGYTPLEPLPFLSQTTNTHLPDLLQALFQLLIIGGAGVATLMITIGGIQYMTGDAIHQKSEGRARIQNSVMGLILLLLIYLILKAVNPNLLNFNLSSITEVGRQSDQIIQQAKATQAQRDAAAATPGPAASTNTGNSLGGGGSGGATNSGSVCPPGDVFCGGGSGIGAGGLGSGTSDMNNNPAAQAPYQYTYDGGTGPITAYTSNLSACQSAVSALTNSGGSAGVSVTSGCSQSNF